MKEPEWLPTRMTSECPVPDGHDTEYKYKDGNRSRNKSPERQSWVLDGIIEYRDWTAFNQQQEKPKPNEVVDMKFDGDKIRMELLPFNSLEAIAEVLTFGAKKYEANSWQTLDNAEERYKGALLRHFAAMQKGESLDGESGLSHAAHMACDALFLLHFELEKLANQGEKK